MYTRNCSHIEIFMTYFLFLLSIRTDDYFFLYEFLPRLVVCGWLQILWVQLLSCSRVWSGGAIREEACLRWEGEAA